MVNFWERQDEVGPHKFNPLLWGGAFRWLVTLLLSSMLVVGKGWCGNLGQWDSWDLSLIPTLLSNLQLPICKNWGPFPKSSAQGSQEILPCIHSWVAPVCSVQGVGQDHQQGNPVGCAHFHHLLQGQCPSRAELTWGTWGLASAHGGCQNAISSG